MSFANSSPLESFAQSYIREFSEGKSSECLRQALETIRSLIRGDISSDDASAAMRATLGRDEPVQRVVQILRMTPDPLPDYAGQSDPVPAPQRQRQRQRMWTEYEDQRLIAAIHLHGLDNWQTLAEFVGNGRSRSQCAQRWNRGLNPDLFKGPWSTSEESELLQLVLRYGEKSWKKIASHFGNRSDVQCRYHYQQMQRGGPRRYLREPVTRMPEPDPERMAADAQLVFGEFSEFGFNRDESAPWAFFDQV